MGRVSAYQLPHTTAPGAEQMSADRSMLDWCAAAPNRAVYRVYSWERPTLSLGRAEAFPAGWNVTALEAAGVDVVRRPTGGDAVLHDGELTFAVAASLPGPWRLRPRAFAETVADALADALREAGLPAA
ncbi:MAG: lipoate--protein ligase family protein, partial [Candidatus Eiseniibacteriota bacterium]